MPEIKPLNASAKNPSARIANPRQEMRHRVAGNPPPTWPETAVGNFFPGLEFNFQNVWKRFFKGLELVEFGGEVLSVDEKMHPTLKGLKGKFLISVDGVKIFKLVNIPELDRAANYRPSHIFLEWSNALAEIHETKAGKGKAKCVFASSFKDGKPQGKQTVHLEVNSLIDKGTALISAEHSRPGEITESLCSPWQTDYVGCSCFYWASNRPDFVNITRDEADKAYGHNWINRDREMRDRMPHYTLDPGKLYTHEDVMNGWEKKFEFVIRGQDSRDGKLPPE